MSLNCIVDTSDGKIIFGKVSLGKFISGYGLNCILCDEKFKGFITGRQVIFHTTENKFLCLNCIINQIKFQEK